MNPLEFSPEQTDHLESAYFDRIEAEIGHVEAWDSIDEFEVLALQSDNVITRMRCYSKIVELAGL